MFTRARSLHAVVRFGLSLSVLFVIVPSARLKAQSASFGGTVLSDANEKPVANVEVVLEGLNRSARSDSAGNFLFTGLSSGKHTVIVRQVGFDALRTEFMLGATQKFEVDLLIKPSVTKLDNVDVKAAPAAGPWAIKLQAFEERRRLGTGRYLTADFFESQGGAPLSSFLASKVPGVKFVQSNGHRWIASARGCTTTKCGQPDLGMIETIPKACYVQVLVNGIIMYNGSSGQRPYDVDELNSRDIIGLEYYTTATTPVQYNSTLSNNMSPCGTIMIWTKGG